MSAGPECAAPGSSHGAWDAVVVGGGFFGCRLAQSLRARLGRVVVLEAAEDILTRASFVNQARVHNGYHYPRSILTALRSRVNCSRFQAEYADCMVRDFVHHYAIGRIHSKVNASRFRAFCERIGAATEPAGREVQELFNRDLVEAVFRVEEPAFDAGRLRQRVRNDLSAAGVELRLGVRVNHLRPCNEGLSVEGESRDGPVQHVARRVFNCTYAQLNRVLAGSGLPLVALRYELAEMALITVPRSLEALAITVMDGPFFSLMPFPPRALYTLSHVRYTPHCNWSDVPGTKALEVDPRDPARGTNYAHMIKDAQRYVPALADSRYVDSLWEIKALLPTSEVDDSRPILFRRDHGLPNLTCVLGGKIDNVYDVLDEVALMLVSPPGA